MSEKEETTEDNDTTEAVRNPFLERLEENQRAKAKAALLQTICENPQQTIGAIFDALDSDDTGDYIMLDLFKRMTIEELIIETANAISGKKTPASASNTPTFVDDIYDDEEDEEDDDEYEDDDDDEVIEVDDDDEYEDEDDEVIEIDDDDDEDDEEPAPKKKKSKKGKKGSKGKKGKKGSKGKKGKKGKKEKTSSEGADGPKTLGAYKKAILKQLRKASEPMSAQNLKEAIGGDDELFVPAKNELVDADEIASEGKARGTKYFIA